MALTFVSGLASQLEQFVAYKQVTRKWSTTPLYYLSAFDKYCAANFPDKTSLCEEMMEWCTEKDTENGNTCSYRVSPIREFVKFSRKMKWTDIQLPESPAYKRRSYVPHFFTESEKTEFFKECDIYVYDVVRYKLKHGVFRVFVYPVYFRWLFSSGLRTNEARLLKVSDVDLINGIININDSKGNDRHRVALHPSMVDVLRQYNYAMSKLRPHRTYFFPSYNGKPFTQRNIEDFFFKVWNRVNPNEHAVVYNFRHNYAIENINKWKDVGYKINDKLVYLGRTMGHVKFSSTMHYFSLAPCFADKMNELCVQPLHELLNDYDEETD